MKRKQTLQSGIFNRRIVIAVALCSFGASLGFLSFASTPPRAGSVRGQQSSSAQQAKPAAQQVLAKLQSASQVQMVTQISRQTGNYNFVRAPKGSLLAADKSSASSEERARAFLATHGALVGISNTERAALSKSSAPAEGSDLRVAKAETDSIGMAHVRLNQFYRGLQIFGAQLIVHMNDRGITAVNGTYVPEVSLSTIPALSKSAAGENAITIVGKGRGGDDVSVTKPAELGIYPTGLLEGNPVVPRLAYALEISGAKIYEQVWVDANTGAVLTRIPLRHTALDRIIYTPQFGEPFDVRHEGDPLTPGPTPGTTGAEPINNLYVFAGHTYNMFSSAFGRDSYDGLGHTMHSVLLANDQCPNAYWNGISTNYCPDFDADDVVSHEWGHAYTQFTDNLVYSYQSGALNESYSDIFGETADLLNGVDAEGGGNNAQPMPAGQRWQIGEDVNVFNQPALGILRDMWNPTTFGQPDKTTSGNYSCGSGDNGGVHANSGVPNHAYAMLVDGKTFNGQTISAIGINRALAIYFRAKQYQTSTTDFAAHADALEAACTDLIGEQLKVVSTSSATGVNSADVVTATTCQQVTKAIQAVELRVPAPCPIIILLDPNEPPPCDGATDIFAEDWETGMDGWTRTSTGVTADWTMDDGVPPGNDQARLRNFNVTSSIPAGGGSGSAIHGATPPIGDDGGGTCSPGGDYSGQYTIENTDPITIPGDASDVKMRFDHWVATETGFDGAQVEISVNGGAFMLVPQSAYLFNPPNSTLTSVIDGNTNPNAGEAAWTGTNVGTPSGSPPGSWGTTIIDLSPLTDPGDTIKIRFTFSQDGCNGVEGWYVDNIRIYACPALTAPALSVGADYENPDTNGSYTLNWNRPLGATGPDVLQVSQTSCAPLVSDDAENGTGQWTIASSDLVAPVWQSAPAGQKPNHNSASFWANPVSEQETQNQNTTLTFTNPITIPSSGITTLSFLEWYFNEDDDRGFVEVSTNNGVTWTPIYTNARPMGDLPDTGVDAFANEGLTRQELNLTPYSGQTIRLRFRYQLGESNFFFFIQYGWYIDDILLVNDNWLDVATTSGTSFLEHKGTGSYCYRVRTTYTLGTETVPSPFSNVVNVTVASGVNPLVSVVSRKTHPGVADFDVNFPLSETEPRGVECRSGGSNNDHTLIFRFATPVTNCGTASQGVASNGPETNECTVNLSGLMNAQYYQVNLNGVVSPGGGPVNVVGPEWGALLGDTNADGSVNSADIAQTKSQSGQSVGAGNFREDLNVDSSINSADIALVKSKSGTALPSSP